MWHTSHHHRTKTGEKTGFALHILTIVICKILHMKNQQMYRLLVYRVTLKRRYQVRENKKQTTCFIFRQILKLFSKFLKLAYVFPFLLN